MIHDLECRKCGAINSTNIIEKEFSGGVHHCAYCATCGAFIKNIAHDIPKFYFGKYKGKAVADVTDLQYLEWFYREIKKPGSSTKNAVAEQIEFLKSK